MPPLVDAALGGTFTVGVDASSNIWQWGTVPIGTPPQAPNVVGNIGVLKSLDSAAGASIAVNQAGEVWAWNDLHNNVLGSSASPMQLDTSGSGPVSAAWTGAYTFVMLNTAGQLWSTGWNAQDPAELGWASPFQNTPALLPVPSSVGTVVGVEVGQCSSGDTVFALNSNGEVWSWGSDDAGCRGDGVGATVGGGATRVMFPPGVSIASMHVGAANPLAIDTLGRVWWWGWSAPNYTWTPVLDPTIQFPVKRAGKSENGRTVVLDLLGRVYVGQPSGPPLPVPAVAGQPAGSLTNIADLIPGVEGLFLAFLAPPSATHESVPSAQIRTPSSSITPGISKVMGIQLDAADPVNTSTGAFQFASSDLDQGGRGESFTFGRTYDSQVSANGVLGVGWTHTYEQKVTADATAGTASWWRDGSRLDFTKVNGTYVAAPGITAQLREVTNGWEAVSKDQVTFKFDSTGKLLSLVDRSNVGVSLAYDAAGRIATVTDAAGRATTFTYGTAGNALGKLTRVQTSDNRLARFAYAKFSNKIRLSSYIDERAKTWTYTYDTNGYLATLPDPNGNTEVTNTYDSQGRVLTQADAMGAVSTFVWDDINEKCTFTDASGAVRVFDTSGLVIDTVTNPSGGTRQTYDANLNIASYQDENGQTSTATYDDRHNMLTRTTPGSSGSTESWTYDQFNNPLTHTDGRGNTTTYTYDANGRMLTAVRPGGVTTGYTWNPDGTLASQTDPRGGVTSYAYDANGLTTSVTSPLGFITSYTYNAAGRVLTITEPRGNVAGAVATQFQRKFTYDADGNVLTERDALNRTTTNVYDNAGRRTQSTAPDGGITTYAYNSANELTAMTAPDGGVTSYQYDNRGLKTQETSPIGAVTTFTYDASGRMTSRIDPRGNEPGGIAANFTATYSYDPMGRMLTQTDAQGRVTSYTYDALGRTTTVVRPDGTTNTTYDVKGNVTSTSRSGLGVTTTTYDALDRPVSVTDARGKTSTTAYDPNGNVVSQTDPLGRKTTFAYDAENRRTSVTDPRGNVTGANAADFTTSYTYDAAGNQLTVTDPLGNTTSTTYNRVSKPASMRNARLQLTSYTYDTMDRVTRIDPPVVGPTLYTYSTMGNVLTRTDPLLRVTNWEWDQASRMTRKTDPLGRYFTYSYDLAGNQTQIVDAVANAANNPALGTTTLAYDNLNRLTSKSFSDGTPSIATTYDAQGRRSSMSDGSGTTTYGYDAAGRVTMVTKGADVFTYSYDENSNIVSRQVPGGANSTSFFDDANQLESITDHNSVTTSFGYDAAGNNTAIAFGNGVSQARSYDRASRLTQVANTGPTGPIGSFTYTRDPNGNPTAVDVSGPAGLIPAESMRNTYDNFDRLTRTCFTTGNCTVANRSTWTYDGVGKRLTEQVGSAPVSTYSYDAADQLTAITGTGAMSFTYNANGDQLTAGGSVFSYNTNRQVVGDTVGGVSRSYAYDGNGNRVSVTTGGSTVGEVWDVNGSLPTLVAERDDAGQVLRRYTYVGVTPLRFSDQSTTGTYETDGLGSVTNITTSAGVVGATYRYSPFGSERASSSVTPAFVANPMRFTGQQRDGNGTYNLRARRYNPALGMFTQTDPMPLGAGSAFEGPYLYARNSPTKYVDPNGKRASLSVGDPIQNLGLDEPRPVLLQFPGFSGIGCKRDTHRPTKEAFVIVATAELRCHTDKPGRSATASGEVCLEGRETSADGWFPINCDMKTTRLVPLGKKYKVILEFVIRAPCENKGRYRTKFVGGVVASPQTASSKFGSEKSGAIGPFRDCGSILRRPDVPDDDQDGPI